jgi:hypothetical protein
MSPAKPKNLAASVNISPLRHEGTKEHKAHNILHSLTWCSFVSLCLSGEIPFFSSLL